MYGVSCQTKIGLIISYLTLMKTPCIDIFISFADVEKGNYIQGHTTNERQSQDRLPPQNHTTPFLYSS